MTQAFYSAIGGMSAGQTQINVVADNIANMNTVGFKASSVQFSDVYYRTLSSGSAPQNNVGGINPKQIGIGVQVSQISRDFNAGTTLATGQATHVSIQGNGFFTVASPTVEVLFTRAGNFELDADGHLVMPNGYKVLGTDTAMTTSTSTIPIKIPTLINTETTPSTNDHMLVKRLDRLNGIQAGYGTAQISTVDDQGQVQDTYDIEITENMTMQQFIDEIKDATGNAVEVTLDNGQLNFKAADGNSSLEFKSGTSSIFSNMNLNRPDGSDTYTSQVLDYQQTIRSGTSSISTAQQQQSISIFEDGTIEVTYGNNDKLSVMKDPDNPNRVIFKYTTNSNIVISGDDIDMEEGLAVPANLQIQMANFVNPNGLKAAGNNTYSTGPNIGLATFGAVSSNAFGQVKSGVLEGSNVDLASEFADMIVAQRAIEANSRVFNASNEILQTLSYLGQ